MIIEFASTIKKTPKSTREILVEIAAPHAELCFEKAVKRLAAEVEIEGFRKGKVPPQMAEKYLKTEAIFEEAAHVAIRETYPEVIRHHGVEPVGQPQFDLTKISRGDILAYTIRLAVLDEATLPDWKKIKVTRKAIEPDAAEVEKALNYLQKSRATYVAASHAAEKGNFAEIDYTIKREGVTVENGSQEKHPFVIGEGRLVPGFEDHVIGMQIGEERTFVLTLPADWGEKHLAGKEVQCSVKLGALMDRKLPERTDDFAKSLGSFDTFAALEKSIRDGIRGEKVEHEQHRSRMEAVEKIAKKTSMEIPDVLVAREIEKMFSDLEERITGMGLTLEGYLTHLKKTREELAKDWGDEAENRVRIALTLRAIAQSEHVEIPEEALEAKMQEIIKNFPSPKEAKKRFNEEALREYAEQVIKNEKVLALIEEHCIEAGK